MTPQQEMNAYETSGTSPPEPQTAGQPDTQTNPEITATGAVPPALDASQPGAEAAFKTGRVPRRTPGLRLFDNLLYHSFNLIVFSGSVFATYLTSHGNLRNAEGKRVFGKIGEIFHKRGTVYENWLRKKSTQLFGTEMSAETAGNWKMVTFSFVDGTLFAPIVKFFEDRRESIAQWIDQRLGTEPEDKSVYAAEPKQTWGSVIAGRAATLFVVLPTAKLLDKKGLNETLFNTPGYKAGQKVEQWLEHAPRTQHALRHINLPELGKVGAFEAFYTSVCTLGLYVSSRLIARLTGRSSTADAQESIEARTVPDGSARSLPAPAAHVKPLHAERPGTRVQQPTQAERLDGQAAPHAAIA